MSLHPHPIGAFRRRPRVSRGPPGPNGSPYLTRRAHLGTIYDDGDFPALLPCVWAAGSAAWRLALVTRMPCRDKLSDRQAPRPCGPASIGNTCWDGVDGSGVDVSCSARSATASWPAAPKHSAGEAVRAVPRPGLAQGSRAAAYGLDARARHDPRVEPSRTRGGNPPGRAERGGHGRA